jgi:hypothetical protein
MTWFYKLLPQLPQVPQELVKLSLSHIVGEQNYQHDPSRQQIDWDMMKRLKILVDGREKQHLPALAWHLDDVIKHWVYNNITDIDVAHVRVSTMIPDDDNDTCGAHRDRARDYALLYVVEDGGNETMTEFYREQGFPLEREKGYRTYDNDKLIKLDAIHIPLHTWCLLNVKVLHGVRYMKSRRVSIQVGLDSLQGLNQYIGETNDLVL